MCMCLCACVCVRAFARVCVRAGVDNAGPLPFTLTPDSV